MDDFSACANAEPVSRLEQLERENADFRTWGIIEIATRNPNVAEYMTHWEARVKTAEAEVTTLRARLETVEAETRERCAERAESFSLAEHIAFDMREGIFPEQSDRQTAIADAIRNLEPRHD